MGAEFGEGWSWGRGASPCPDARREGWAVQTQCSPKFMAWRIGDSGRRRLSFGESSRVGGGGSCSGRRSRFGAGVRSGRVLGRGGCAHASCPGRRRRGGPVSGAGLPRRTEAGEGFPSGRRSRRACRAEVGGVHGVEVESPGRDKDGPGGGRKGRRQVQGTRSGRRVDGPSRKSPGI